ncbi:MAG: hypothetical protein R2725_03225 [Solirubrobacterales bacterium]
MSLLTAWIVFPLVAALLCAGTGLLVDLLSGGRLSGALILPAGFALLVVAGISTTALEATAGLTVPLAVALAAAGAGLTLLDWRFGRPDPWAAGVAVAVFLVFAAPVVLSGEPTFAGYIKLDDTATWIAMTDRLMDSGLSLAGLEPSTYRSALEAYTGAGYPVGANLPWGIAGRITGQDFAWTFDPYIAFMAALLSLSFGSLCRRLVGSPVLRSLVVFVAAQAALLYGYYLWGGVKEVAATTLVAFAAAMLGIAVRPVATVARRGAGARAALPLALAAAALAAVLSPAGLIWIGVLLAGGALWAWRELGPRGATVRAAWLAALALLLMLPLLAGGHLTPPVEHAVTDQSAVLNLLQPLHPLQVMGVWPSGDFRLRPSHLTIAWFLALAAAALALAGVYLAVRGRAWRVTAFIVTAALACAAIAFAGSPWVEGKAMATASPAFLLAALIGAALLYRRFLPLEGGILLALLAVGVLWSNALAYHDVSLAPYAQLRELELIGEEHAGQGPALMTEYQPYGVRHFLRDLDAEGASELRYRPVSLVDGTTLEKGDWADTDEVSLDALLTYRTLVLRRSPAQSRPPSVYSLVRAGDFYDVWQRPLQPARPILEHLPLGDFDDPGAVPACDEVRRLADLAGPGGEVAAVHRSPNAVSLQLRRVRVPRAGLYDVYALGSVRNRVTALLDGEEVGSVAMQLNEARQFVDFGRVRLDAGAHRVQLLEDGQSLAPGTGGPPPPLGPLVLSPSGGEDPRVVRVPASRADRLCGQRLDWIEALPAR